MSPQWDDAAFIRAHATRDDLVDVARNVRERRCQCCGCLWADVMGCGHRICDLCEARGHVCVACVLAT